MRRGLFDRLESGDRSIGDAESIVAHLHALLNARGIVDLTDLVHTLPDGMRSVELALRRAIETYEPRLTQVSVRHLPGDDALRLDFQVQARLAADPRKALRLRTWVRLPGRFAVD
jgi:type VI secretion system protein